MISFFNISSNTSSPVKPTVLLLALMSLFALTNGQQALNQDRFDSLISKMEGDALELASEVERLYEQRCSLAGLADCANANYDDCRSMYPAQTCPAGDDLVIPLCGDGVSCSGLYDYTVSAVTLPRLLAKGVDGNPTDTQVIETVCFTRELDKWFVQKKAGDASFWQTYNGVEPTAMFMGSHNGAFRIFPARHTENCGSYDPRLRPWYVAASSGPKNVVLILDTSGSMEGLRMDLMKEATVRVLETLTVADRVAIVSFNTEASVIANQGGKYLYTATDENKDILLQAVENLQAGGATNFYDAFTKAFDILDLSIDQEYNVNCNSAILFLTDGVMTEPDDIQEQDVLNLVNERMNQTFSAGLKDPVLVLTYSVSEEADVAAFPSQLACSSQYGVWTKVSDASEIVDSLSTYYLLFSLGLGADVNSGFTAWVEPYKFATGGELGTTVSVPIYDRSKQPPLFLGVIGIDFSLAAFDLALGLETGSGSQESINGIVRASTAKCPTLTLETCELESFRRRGSTGDNALCHRDSCSEADFVQTEEVECSAVDDYPRDLWVNTGNADVSYEERVCCSVGESEPSNSCGSSLGLRKGAKVAMIVLACVMMIFVCFFLYLFYLKQRVVGGQKHNSSSRPKPTAPLAIATEVLVVPRDVDA